MYRLENHLVSAGVDEWDNPLGPPRMEVYVNKFIILKKTPKGVWISYCGGKRFVLLSARKQFACLTLEQAVESFKARKRRQISILARKLEYAEMAVSIAESRDWQNDWLVI